MVLHVLVSTWGVARKRGYWRERKIVSFVPSFRGRENERRGRRNAGRGKESVPSALAAAGL